MPAANGRWICADSRFRVAEAAYQTERGQLIACPVSKPFSGSENSGHGGVRSNPYIRLELDNGVIRIRYR